MIIKKINQEITKENANPCDAFLNSPEANLTILGNAPLKILNFFIGRSNLLPKLYYSQQTVAENIGYKCRQTINRNLPALVELGLISKTSRFNDTCEYKLASYFFETKNRHKLKHILTNLAFIPWILMTIGIADLEPNVTRVKVKLKDYISNVSKFNVNTYISNVVKLINGPLPNQKMIKEENMLPKWLNGLYFSDVGKMKLKIFPQEALKYAYDRLKSFPPKMQEEYFINASYEYCRLNEIQVDWKLFYKEVDNSPQKESYRGLISALKQSKLQKEEDDLKNKQIQEMRQNTVPITLQHLANIPLFYEKKAEEVITTPKEDIVPSWYKQKYSVAKSNSEAFANFEREQYEKAQKKKEEVLATLRQRGLI